MVAEISASSNPSINKRQSPAKRAPLLPSEKDNGVISRRPRAKQVSSRYLSPSPSTSTSTSTTTTTTTTSSSSSSSSRRFGSPFLTRPSNAGSPMGGSSGAKRAQSVDRRRPVSTPRAVAAPVNNVGEVSNAARLLITSSRSLSVSFQGEAFSLPISKAKAPPTPSSPSNVRKGTPERRRVSTPVKGRGDQVENCKSIDQHRWPARARQGNLGSVSMNSGARLMSRSVDCGDGTKKLSGIGSGVAGRLLQASMEDECRRRSFDGRMSFDLGNATEMLKSVTRIPDGNLGSESSLTCDLTASDTDSVSSGSASSLQESGGAKQKTVPKGIVVSSRFWQETNSRLRRLQDPGSPLASSPSSRAAVAAKVKRFSTDSLSSPRTMASPVRGSARPASPSKLWASMASSPSRGNSSPSRVRSYVAGSLSSNSMDTPSILSFSVDIRRGKVGEDRIVKAHMLRLLHNRHLQWRFVNASADATCMVQGLNAERHLWNAWVTVSELRQSVTLKRMKLLLVRQKLKLASILKGQMAFLEEWALLEKDHYSSLVGAKEALNASTLRLPLVEKALVNIQTLEEAIGSAVDVMQAMASSIRLLSSKAQEMNGVVAELVKITAKERLFLDQCKEFLSAVAAMQVKDCSLRTHIIQVNRVPSSTSLTTRL